MHVNKPALHPMASAALVEIQAAGVAITPEIVLWVHDAATQIRKTPMRSVAELVDWPVECGGVLLYPVTIGAVEWLMRLPERMRSDARVIAWAMANGKRPDAFAGQSVARVALTVAAWSSRLTCSLDALAATVDSLLGTERYVEIDGGAPRKRDADSWQWGAAIRALCTKYPGTTPEYWTWDVSRDRVCAALQSINEDMPQDGRVTDYEIESNAAFRAVVRHIIATEGQPNG